MLHPNARLHFYLSHIIYAFAFSFSSSSRERHWEKGKKNSERIFHTHTHSFYWMEMKIFKKSSILNQSEIRSRIIFYLYVWARRGDGKFFRIHKARLDGRKMSRWPFSVFLLHSLYAIPFFLQGNKSHRSAQIHAENNHKRDHMLLFL